MPNMQGHCWDCGQALADLDFQRTSECPGCRRHTHVCRNCRFYHPGLHNDCEEPVADSVADKVRANFCDYFSPNPRPPVPGTRDADPDDLLAAAEALFNAKD